MTPLSGDIVGLVITIAVAAWIVNIAGLVAWTLRPGGWHMADKKVELGGVTRRVPLIEED